ncbi:MAG: hypothetical protein WCP11_01585 [Candidatus Saccharibacteria bacterium]
MLVGSAEPSNYRPWFCNKRDFFQNSAERQSRGGLKMLLNEFVVKEAVKEIVSSYEINEENVEKFVDRATKFFMKKQELKIGKEDMESLSEKEDYTPPFDINDVKAAISSTLERIEEEIELEGSMDDMLHYYVKSEEKFEDLIKSFT